MEDRYLSELPKSMNRAGLVHFSFEVLGRGSKGEFSTVAFGLWVPFSQVSQQHLEPLQAFLEVSCHFADVFQERLQGCKTLVKTIVDYWMGFFDVTSVTR